MQYDRDFHAITAILSWQARHLLIEHSIVSTNDISGADWWDIQNYILDMTPYERESTAKEICEIGDAFESICGSKNRKIEEIRSVYFGKVTSL